MPFLKTIISDTLHLFYPHLCKGCGTDILQKNNLLCIRCINQLPHTGFAPHPGNPVEKYFWGRLPLSAAHSEFYFSKTTLIQQLIHRLKYKGDTAIGEYLGTLTGQSLLKSGRFNTVDALVPLPLYPDKERKRGYNQAALICRGVSSVLNIPVITGNILRRYPTETQTRKQRTERWENVSESFAIRNRAEIKGKHLLLVDDVVTTGATLEACGSIILQAENTRLSIVTLAHASK